MRTMRSVRAPTPGSCVTITTVNPRRAFKSRIKPMISSAVAESSAPVGSSAQTMAGSLTSARAIVTRCRCPPDSSAGRCAAHAASPTVSSAARAASAPPSGAPRDQQRQFHVLHRGEDRQQVVDLEDEAHAAGAVLGALAVGELGQVLAFEPDRAGVDGVEAGEGVEQRRLAAAGGAHDGDHLAALDGEVDAAQGVDPIGAGVVGLDDPLRPDDEVVAGRAAGARAIARVMPVASENHRCVLLLDCVLMMRWMILSRSPRPDERVSWQERVVPRGTAWAVDDDQRRLRP